MRNKPFISVIVLISCAIALTFVPVAKAEYPDKPIEFVTHGGPGGGSDIFTRTIAHILESEGIVKQKIRVSNRRGGSGTVAMDYIASKKGDPYVVMTISTSPLNSMIRGSSRMRYEDITLVTNLVQDVIFLFARQDAPYKDMKGLVGEAKKSKREINIAIGSVGGMEHISAHRVTKSTGVPTNIVSFKSGAGSATALLGGHADLNVGNLNEFMGQIEAKKVKILGAMTEERIPFLPDVETMKEQGYNVVCPQIRGFWAPQDFPSYALKYWEDAFAKVMETKAFDDYLKSISGVKLHLKGKEFRTFLDNFVANMVQDLKELDIYEKK